MLECSWYSDDGRQKTEPKAGVWTFILSRTVGQAARCELFASWPQGRKQAPPNRPARLSCNRHWTARLRPGLRPGGREVVIGVGARRSVERAIEATDVSTRPHTLQDVAAQNALLPGVSLASAPHDGPSARLDVTSQNAWTPGQLTRQQRGLDPSIPPTRGSRPAERRSRSPVRERTPCQEADSLVRPPASTRTPPRARTRLRPLTRPQERCPRATQCIAAQADWRTNIDTIVRPQVSTMRSVAPPEAALSAWQALVYSKGACPWKRTPIPIGPHLENGKTQHDAVFNSPRPLLPFPYFNRARYLSAEPHTLSSLPDGPNTPRTDDTPAPPQ